MNKTDDKLKAGIYKLEKRIQTTQMTEEVRTKPLHVLH